MENRLGGITRIFKRVVNQDFFKEKHALHVKKEMINRGSKETCVGTVYTCLLEGHSTH